MAAESRLSSMKCPRPSISRVHSVTYQQDQFVVIATRSDRSYDAASQAAKTAQPMIMKKHLRDKADVCEIIPDQSQWLSSAEDSSYLS